MIKKKVNWGVEIKNIALIVVVSVLVAMGLHIFVYKADFAPSGIDGLATILQYLTKINAGYYTFILNLPLLIIAWFVLKKRYVIYTVIYTVIVSVTLNLCSLFNLYQYDCGVAPNSHLVAAIFGGICQGVTGILLRVGGSSGGVDILGCLIQKKFPHKNVENIIAYLSYAVVGISFFVYDMNVNSVCLSVVEIFVCERLTASILKDRRSAVKFEIVTDSICAKEIKNNIIFNFRHGATIIKGEGAFSEQGKEVILCLVSYREIAEFLKMMKQYKNTFLYYSDVMGISGNFSFEKTDETEEDKKLLASKLNEINGVKE